MKGQSANLRHFGTRSLGAKVKLMKTSNIRYSQLRTFLRGIGFTDQADNEGWRFEHSTSGAVFLFRRYRPADRVYEHDLLLVRSQLDGRGLLPEQAFSDELTKTPA